MAWNERAKHDDLDLFQEQEADGSDALNDDTFGDASPVGDDWQPSAAQEAFHRELQQARNSPSLGPDEGLSIGPPPGLGKRGQEPRHAPRGRPRDPRGDPRGDPRDLRDPRQTAFEALRSLGLENPPSLLGQPPPAGLFDGLSSLPRGLRPDPGPAYPRPNPMLGAKGWPCAAAAAATAPTVPPPFPRPDLLGRFSHFPRPDGIPQQLAALAALRRMAPPPAPPTPARQIMSVTELEAQMMADQVPRPPSPLASLGLGPPGPPPAPMAHKMTHGPGITSTRPPGLMPRPPGPPGPPREVAPIPSFLDSLLVEDEPAVMPLSPGAYTETRKWISPFTDKHREAVLDGTGSLSKQILEPFLQSESSGRQHVGLMTASDKELIVQIQLGQLASIGEMEPHRDGKAHGDHGEHSEHGEHGDHSYAHGEHLESTGHGSAEVADRSFGALRASVHHSRASVDVTSTDLPAEGSNARG